MLSASYVKTYDVIISYLYHSGALAYVAILLYILSFLIYIKSQSMSLKKVFIFHAASICLYIILSLSVCAILKQERPHCGNLDKRWIECSETNNAISFFVWGVTLPFMFAINYIALNLVKQTRVCRFCKTPLKSGATICAACGSDQAQEFVCPYCQETIELYDKNEGDIVQCPHCQGGFKIS